MAKIFLAGAIGALGNFALTFSLPSASTENAFQDLMMVEPISALRTAVQGFFFGSGLALLLSLLRALVIRYLLDYNGWFLRPKSVVNSAWYMLMVALLGRKNLGSGKYQQYLPSLPVPSLKATCKRYLDSVRPLLTPEEYKETELAVQEFQQREGTKLQFYLQLKWLTSRNWIKDWWVDYVYLRQRTPIAINSNYFASDSTVALTDSQLDRVAMTVYLAIDGTKKILDGEVENFQANELVPFCSGSAKFLTNTARIPGKEIDRIANYDHHQIRHVVVLRKGKFYKMDVVSKDGHVLPPIGIKKQVEKIVNMAGDELDETGVMAFTALPRDKWAEIRKRLEENSVNKETLLTIDSSYIIVSIEDEAVSMDYTSQAQALFHGNGFNRWFDKSIVMSVYTNGILGSNVEHTRLDATVGGQLWSYILSHEQYSENGRVLQGIGGREFAVPEPTQLQWNLEGFEQDLLEAKENLRNMVADSDMVVVTALYSKRVPKQCHLSPDGWFQMALQLTYYRMYKKLVLTYESATTRLYYEGRTETIRPVSDKSKAFVEAMDDPAVPRDEVKRLFKEAISYQEKYKLEAMRGMGVDRHLFGLYVIAQGMKMDPLPRIFRDKAFKLPFTLSTSQTPIRFIKQWPSNRPAAFGGFGTVAEDGYGISYIVVSDDELNFCIHSKRSCVTTDSFTFGNELQKVMEDLRGLYKEELSAAVSHS